MQMQTHQLTFYVVMPLTTWPRLYNKTVTKLGWIAGYYILHLNIVSTYTYAFNRSVVSCQPFSLVLFIAAVLPFLVLNV